MEELWKPIDGYDGWYEISNHGRVRSFRYPGRGAGMRREVPKILSLTLSRGGYLGVTLPDGKGKTGYCHRDIHRFVALAFLGAPASPDATVNHKDLNKTNNHVENLEWMSQADNVRHAVPSIRRRRGESTTIHKLTDDSVREIRAAHLQGVSTNLLAVRYGVSGVTAWKVATRRKWRHVA